MEIWKDIIGYEGYYQISNQGRVKCLVTDSILKLSRKKTGYLAVSLSYMKKREYSVHRLVAEMFIPNPMNFPQVNHKDEIKTNNFVENLEWCTAKYNVNYGYGSLARNSGVLQFSLDGKCLCVWSSIKEAAEALGIKYQNISRVCRGIRKTSGGYIWRYIPNYRLGSDGDLLEIGSDST